MNMSSIRSFGVGAFAALLVAVPARGLCAGFDRRDVTFASQGLKCAGWYYVPAGLKIEEKRPAIVMAHGFSAVKEMGLDKYAEKLTAAGFVVLAFDFRYFGASEGEPRGQIFYFDQHQDYRNAISWLALQKEVDAQRIGAWGTSNSGGHVLHLAAFDKRIKAVVAQVPGVSAWDARFAKLPPEELAGAFRRLAASRNESYATGRVAYFPVVTPDPKQRACMPSKEAYDFFIGAFEAKAPNWRNQVTVESLEVNMEYRPMANIHLISPTPLLMIVTSHDTITPTELQKKAFEQAKEPKRLVVLEGGHFDAYSGAGFEVTSKAAVEWFTQHLASRG
jgi:fermentation-respiration switch protein FrsA (DUF1100 family)